jgi:hypothetical protein
MRLLARFIIDVFLAVFLRLATVRVDLRFLIGIFPDDLLADFLRLAIRPSSVSGRHVAACDVPIHS